VRLPLSLALGGALAAAGASRRAAAQETKVTLDTMVYHDTDHVDVVSPQLSAWAPLDSRGGEVSVTGVVDIVSAASVDVITEATPGFTEVREEGDLRISKRLGDWLPGAHYRYSHEPDYLSNRGGLSLQRPLRTEDTTLTVGLDVTYDQVGRHGTSFESFERTLWTVAAELGVTQVVDPRTLVRLVYSLTVQDGYLAKPYRYVPLFDAAGLAAAAADGVSLDATSFDRYRLPERPPENVPDLRVRHAVGVRGLRYLPGIDGSVRLDYRIYLDDWGMWAHTVEAGLRFPAGKTLAFELSSRTNYQTSVWFWEKEYLVSGPGVAPQYLTVDKDLSSSLAETLGARAAWRHGRLEVHANVDVTYQRFFDYLFLDSRTAFVTTAGVRWDL
jgi:uncharacterized protein DUF3570